MITDLSVGNIPVLGYVSRKIILSYVPENQKIHLLDGLRDRLNIINRNIQNTQRIFKEDSNLKYGEVDLGKLLKRSNL
ncbi:unnamed protein product [Rhizophagus irregularis]|nr:hypothetical protein RIR_jg7355.t1 [Rhizophagus irregularis DAOM 181602=DAOM 197198]CAB4416018.1 unnamed protein product [Rhizophagus irregularis]